MMLPLGTCVTCWQLHGVTAQYKWYLLTTAWYYRSVQVLHVDNCMMLSLDTSVTCWSLHGVTAQYMCYLLTTAWYYCSVQVLLVDNCMVFPLCRSVTCWQMHDVTPLYKCYLLTTAWCYHSVHVLYVADKSKFLFLYILSLPSFVGQNTGCTRTDNELTRWRSAKARSLLGVLGAY